MRVQYSGIRSVVMECSRNIIIALFDGRVGSLIAFILNSAALILSNARRCAARYPPRSQRTLPLPPTKWAVRRRTR